MTISILCATDRAEGLRQLLFRETGTLGVRSHAVDKQALDREWVEVETALGTVRVKIGRLEGHPVSVAPEYEDCARVARDAGVPARQVYDDAVRLARDVLRSPSDDSA
jgi:uncharacterized protein (DUF111 family)